MSSRTYLCWIEKKESICLKISNGEPVKLSAEEARTVARDLIEQSVRLDYIDGDEVERLDWMRIPMQYIHYHAGQDPNFSHEEQYAGADVECWIKDQTQKNALLIAQGWLRESGWLVRSLEQHIEISKDDFEEGDEDIAYYDQAISDNQVFVYNVYRDSLE